MAKEKLDTELLKRLHAEIKLAEKRNEAELLPVIRENISRYTGKFIPQVGEDWDILLNEVYPIVQFNVPSVFFRNPKAFVKPKRKTFIQSVRNVQTGKMEEVTLDSSKSARTQEHLLNYTVEEIRYKQEFRKVVFDAHLAQHGVMWHGYKGEFGMTEEQALTIKNEQVFVRRLSPLRFLFDPSVNLSNLDEARWVARSFDIPLMDLLEDDTLDVDKRTTKGKAGFGDRFLVNEKDEIIKANATDILPHSTKIRDLLDFADKDFRDSEASRFIKLYEVLLRPTRKEKKEKKKGKIILLSEDQFQALRFGKWPYKAEGFPAKILEFNGLNDAAFGLDDISTYSSIADNKNIMRNIQIRNAQENSKVWIFLAKDGVDGEEDLEKIRNGDQTIILFNGDSIQNKAQVSSAGLAASQELYLIDGRLDKELQDKSGVSDLKKGFLQSGEESATSVKLRSAGGAVRPAYRQDIVSDFLKDSFKYILQLIKEFVPIKGAVRIMGTTDIQWSDEFTKEDIQAETDIDIDVISMAPENPEKEIQELTVILNLMRDAMSNPVVMEKIQQEGKTFNFSPVINNLLLRLRIRDPEVFREIKAEESEGFVSVSELRIAKKNIEAALNNQPPPSPPAPGQDHRARLELYTAVQQLLEATGNASDVLNQIIETQMVIMQEEEKKQNPQPGQKV